MWGRCDGRDSRVRALSGIVCYVAAMHSAPESEFARILTGIEERTGLSHQRIAEAAGVDRSQVWRWVSSGSKPGYEPVRRLAAWLIAERPEVAAEAARLLPAAGYETPPATAPPRRPRRLKALEDSDEPGLQPFLQAVRREVYTAAGIIGMFPPGADLPGPEDLPELEPLLDALPGEAAFPDSTTEPAVWETRDRLNVPERIRLVARIRHMSARHAGGQQDRSVSGLAPAWHESGLAPAWHDDGADGAVPAERHQAGVT